MLALFALFQQKRFCALAGIQANENSRCENQLITA